MQRSHKSDKKMNKTQENSDVAKTAEHGEDSDDKETASGEANVIASINQNALLEGLTLLSEELKDFKEDMRWELSEFKNDVKKTMKDDLTEFKDEVLRELQSQNISIVEAQTRITDLESACLEMKDTLLKVVKQRCRKR